MAWRASGSAISLNTFARSNPYSLLSTSTILVLASPPSTPTRRPFSLSMLSIVEPGGAMTSATTGLMTPTAWAFVGPSGQPRPDEGKAQRAYQRAGQSAAVLAVPSQSESSGAQTLGRN